MMASKTFVILHPPDNASTMCMINSTNTRTDATFLLTILDQMHACSESTIHVAVLRYLHFVQMAPSQATPPTLRTDQTLPHQD
jgi:hypothetical protein